MRDSIIFSRRHSYADRRGIEVQIELKLTGSRAVRLYANVDTGASFCIFQREYGEQLGLSIETGKPERVRTADGGAIEVFGHEVTMTLMDWDIDSLVYFAKEFSFVKNVVGQLDGWINLNLD